MTTYPAKCHCGQTEWTIKLENPEHVLCHCNACKLLGGGAFTLNLIVPKDAIDVTKGKEDLKVYTYTGDSGMLLLFLALLSYGRTEIVALPGNAVHCYYCPNCTSHVYHHQTVLGDRLIARTIFAEGGKDFKPVLEIYGKVRLPWLTEVAQTLELAPP